MTTAIEKEIKGTIPQYRKAARILAAGGIYTRTSPHAGRGYLDLNRDCMAAYVLEDGQVKCIMHNVRTHRGRQAIKAYRDYKSGIIPAWVWDNYITNGKSTRRGLYADYSSKEERIKKIARSHADYMGSETGNSTADHNARVGMRN